MRRLRRRELALAVPRAALRNARWLSGVCWSWPPAAGRTRRAAAGLHCSRWRRHLPRRVGHHVPAGRRYEARARRRGQAMRDLAAAGAGVLTATGPSSGSRPPCCRRASGSWSAPGADRRRRRGPVRPVRGGSQHDDGRVGPGRAAGDRDRRHDRLTGRLVVRPTRWADTQLAHLIKLVEQAQAGKASIQRLADRICAVFVPLVLACSALTPRSAGWLGRAGCREPTHSVPRWPC